MLNFLSLLSKKSVKWLILVIAILIMLLLFRSCSDELKEHHGPYKIGRDTSWYPLQLFGKEKYLVAFTNDIVARIASANDLEFQWINSSPQSLTDGLDEGLYDLILTTLRPTVINQKQYLFSEIVFECGPVLVVREDSKAASLDDMKDKTIGILSGQAPVFNSIRIAGAHDFDLLVVTYNNAHEAVNDLLNKSIDGIIIEAIPAYNLTQGFFAGRLKIVTTPFTDEGLRFMVLKNKNFGSLIDIINASLDKMHQDETYKALIQKWDLLDPKTSYRTLSKKEY